MIANILIWLFTISYFTFLALFLFMVLRAVIVQQWQRDKKGWGKCSVCDKAPGTIYFYNRWGVTYYHCREHMGYDHRTPKTKNNER